MQNNQYQQYQNNSVMTASPDQLTLMLYNGAIRFGNMAKKAMEEKNIQESHNSILKAQRIIEELDASLDDKYPIAKEMSSMYEFIYHQLVEANASKEAEDVDVALDFIREMRDTWGQAMKLSKKVKEA